MTRFSLLLLLAASALPSSAQVVSTDHDWCDRDRNSYTTNDKVSHCEVRTSTLRPGELLRVDASPNGGIQVEGWERDEVQIEARVEAHADSDAEARALARRVTIETDGTLRAVTPSTDDHDWITVSFRLMVPRQSNLDLSTQNGGIAVEEVSGRIHVDAMNGGVTLDGVGGEVTGGTTNGGLDVHLSGRRWEGERLDVATTNGGIDLHIPEGYSAELETGTVNGRLRLGFPVTVQGDVSRTIRTTLGEGGPLVRVKTTNGGVTVDRD